MKINFQYKNKTGYIELKNMTETSADLIVYGEIASEKLYEDDVTPAGVKELLDSAEGKDLKIYINSPGGSAFAGVAIYNMLLRHSGKKEVFIDGLAASAASIIAMAGDVINIPKNAYLMIHRAWTFACGNKNEMQKTLELLERLDSSIAETYVSKSVNDTTAEKFLELMDKDTWLNGNEAKKYFNVNVTEAQEAAACISISDCERYRNIPENLKNSIEERENKKQQAKNKELELEKAKLELLTKI